MHRRTRAWQLLFSASLLLGCKNPEPADGKLVNVECGAYTKCPSGYECNYGGKDSKNPKVTGLCEYVTCGLTDLCKKPHPECSLKEETAKCDKFDNDHYCECIRPSSQDVPTGGTGPGDPTPTTGDKP